MTVNWTPKENFMAVVNGEVPQSIPIYNMGMPFPQGGEPTRSIKPNLFPNDTSRTPQGGYDIWGVHYVANEETNYASLPEPGNFILDDITKWRDIIVAPEVPDVDWEAMAKADYEKAKINRDTTAVILNAGFSPFQRIVAFMGFSEALCALYEEPDEVKAMYDYLCDFYLPIIEKSIDYYKPDIFYMADDSASKYNPFFSPEIYEDIYLPVYQRLAKPANDRGIPIGFHNCGRCEPFVDMMVSFGVRTWDPCQTLNDLDGLKKKYQGRLALAGGWELVNLGEYPSRDEIRQYIYDTVDRFAPGGGYMFAGGVLGRAGDENAKDLQNFIRSTALEYCDHYYEKH